MKRVKTWLRAAIPAALIAGTAHAGPILESGDAGQTMGTAQVVGAGFDSIKGAITTGDRADVYRFFHPGGAFGATTDNGLTGGSLADTQLFLFDSTGMGIVARDDITATNFRSALSLASLAAGYYFLGISDFDQDPIDASANQIFPDIPTTAQVSANGGVGPLADFSLATLDDGTYTIELRTPTGEGSATVPEPGTLSLMALSLLGIGALRRRA